MKSIGSTEKAGFDRIESFPPKENPDNIFGIMPVSRAEQYDTYEIIKCIVDNSEYDEYKPDYGKSIICATARVDGWSVGIVANQRKLVKSGKEKCSSVE
jgi:acetyl-CoA carboxylase carboxyltransferase component